jgi:coenzyme F420 hydrogenase subunit beta
MPDSLQRAVNRVLRSDNCSGCGACALLSRRITMALDDDGFMRPHVAPSADAERSARVEATAFRAVCPGVGVDAPVATAHEHPLFGRYVSAWQGAATDRATRTAGSSGGVLTALSEWLLTHGEAESVTSVKADPVRASRTVPVTIMSADEARRSAGSRYAPVAALAQWPGGAEAALVAKPCEVAAARALVRERGGVQPVMLSFFCAGTPSQQATDDLIMKLTNRPAASALAMQYRGNGWPGAFTVRTSDGDSAECSYEESWGMHLGRQLQWRCKICVDGTGMSADVAVGDLWDADEAGFPVFDEGEGNSVIIARTARGDAILRAAAQVGVVSIAPLRLDQAARVQPLQRQRRQALGGRLTGRVLAGKRVPRYHGYGVGKRTLRFLPANARAAVGTFLRSVGLRG